VRGWLLALLLLMAADVARADDWVAALDVPPLAEDELPELRLVYPVRGLPAVVAAGEVLVARVLVPAALTPPPGVQQARALRGFSAELIGGGLVLQAGAQHRHRVSISEVRPDGPSSLLYRMRIEVPAYVAPGTYALVLRTPFGEREALAAVRVIAKGAVPRLGACPPPSAADLGSWPIDVWVCDDAGWPKSDPTLAQGDAARLALADAPAFALRVGRELWLHDEAKVRGGGFARDAGDASSIERRARVELTPASLERRLTPLTAAGRLHVQRLDHALAVQCAAAPSSNARAGDGGARAAAAGGGEGAHEASASPGAEDITGPAADGGGPRSCELTLLLPARARVHVDRGALALYPAGDLQMREVRSVAGLWRVPAGAARLEIAPAPARAAYRLARTRARSGERVSLRVQGVPADARVAFDYGHGRSAFAGPELRASFAGPLEAPVRALVLPRDGGARLLRARVLVEPSRPPSCDIGRRQRQEPGHGSAVATMALSALGFLLKRRSARGLGNRLGRDDRCERRDGLPHGTPHPHSLPGTPVCSAAVRARRL
jgi:hypothetical protein